MVCQSQHCYNYGHYLPTVDGLQHLYPLRIQIHYVAFHLWLVCPTLIVTCRLGRSKIALVKGIFCLIFLVAAVQFFLYFIEITGLKQNVDPDAVRGYSHCVVNQSRLSRFSREHPCNFIPKPISSDVVIVTFVNSAWIDLTRNWICSAKKVGLEKNLFLIAFEPNVCSQFQGTSCYQHQNLNIKHTVFGQPGYQKLVIERTRLILNLLSCGQRILLADADITFLRNPLDYLATKSKSYDILFQADSTGVGFLDSFLHHIFHYICGGFIYMKSNYATRHLWLSVLNYQTKYKWNDQAGLNICIRHHSQSIRWSTLDAGYFPNGKQYFFYNEGSKQSMIVHANHIMGTKRKIMRMIASEVWCWEELAVQWCRNSATYREMCEPRNYLTPEGCNEFVNVCQRKYRTTSVKYDL